MIPAAGFAAEGAADEVSTDADIELLSATDATAFSKGQVTQALIGKDSTTPTDTYTMSYAKNKSFTFKPTEITLPSVDGSSDPIVLTNAATGPNNYLNNKANYEVTYWQAEQNNQGQWVASDTQLTGAPKEIGTYIARVTAKAEPYANGSIDTVIAITGEHFQDLTLGEQNGTIFTAKSKFVYTGETLKVALENGPAGSRVTLTEGKDYTLTWYSVANPNTALSSAPTNAGTYNVEITGIGRYATQTQKINGVEIQALDLDFDVENGAPKGADDYAVSFGAIVTANDVAPTHPTSVTITPADAEGKAWDTANAKTYTNSTILNAFTLINVVGTSGEVWPGKGSYTASAIVSNTNPNFTGTTDGPTGTLKAAADIEITKVDAEPAFFFNGAAMPSSTTISASEFEVANVKAFTGSNKAVQIPSANVDYELLDADGATIASTAGLADTTRDTAIDTINAAVRAGGDFTLIATVSNYTAANGDVFGGSKMMQIHAIIATLDTETNVFVSYNGQPCDEINAVYSSQDIMDNIGISVYSNVDPDHPLVEGEDYEVTYTDADGNEVNNLVDAGTYTLSFSSEKYAFANGTDVSITIDPLTINSFTLNEAYMDNNFGNIGFNYTKNTVYNQLVLALTYGTNQPNVKPEKWEYATELVTDGFEIVIKDADGKVVEPEDLIDLGEYTVALALIDEDDSNYAIGDSVDALEFSIIGVPTYADVPTTFWGFADINNATRLGYMKGYEGTRFFGPNNKLTRAEMAQVLYNMAGNPNFTPDDGAYNEVSGYISFSDVNGKMWYGQAIAWAKYAGIVKGYGDTGLFMPDNDITREEFCQMLANYAQKVDRYTPVENVDATLAGATDGSAVSDWAKPAVAWAYAADYIGRNNDTLFPQNDITRAETAAMAVRFQPTKLGNWPANGDDGPNNKPTTPTPTPTPDGDAVSTTLAGSSITYTVSADIPVSTKPVVATEVGKDSTLTFPDGATAINYVITKDFTGQSVGNVAIAPSNNGEAVSIDSQSPTQAELLITSPQNGDVITYVVTSQDGKNTQTYRLTLKAVDPFVLEAGTSDVAVAGLNADGESMKDNLEATVTAASTSADGTIATTTTNANADEYVTGATIAYSLAANVPGTITGIGNGVTFKANNADVTEGIPNVTVANGKLVFTFTNDDPFDTRNHVLVVPVQITNEFGGIVTYTLTLTIAV